MSIITDIADLFGIRNMPVAARVFLLLFLIFTGLLVFAVMQGTTNNANADKLFSVSTDGLKTVLGAIVGSYTTARAAQARSNGKQRGKDRTIE
jgi:hypothetical protein